MTYHSCMVKAPGVEYLSVGRKGLFLDLSLAYPAGEYRSKATMALAKMFHEIYQEASIPAIGQGICPALRPAFRPAASGQASWDGFPEAAALHPAFGPVFCLYAISGALPLRWDLPGSQTSLLHHFYYLFIRRF